ncbi:hypothetical protein Rhal01_02513 [Rubritalea halochordaticola]|uniref:Uncharacterized protein n=1 Tax=Rubritalea halochordaticola TaxID=714537 RepID=A0ABP9V2U5_9BACT
MLNARTWHKLCLSGYLMFPALVAYWVFPDHPLIWLAYLALLWGGLVFVAGGLLCLLMTFGKMGLGCPICRAHSEVQGIHQSRITIQCPECGEMDLRIGQLSGLLSNEPKVEITDEDYLADDRPRYRSILHVPFCHPVAFGLLYFPVVGVIIAAAVIHQFSWFYLLIPGFFCYFLSGFILESLFTGKMTDKGETITRAYSPFRFYSSLCSWLGVYLFALAFPVGFALQESKKEQTTQQEAVPSNTGRDS